MQDYRQGRGEDGPTRNDAALGGTHSTKIRSDSHSPPVGTPRLPLHPFQNVNILVQDFDAPEMPLPQSFPGESQTQQTQLPFQPNSSINYREAGKNFNFTRQVPLPPLPNVGRSTHRSNTKRASPRPGERDRFHTSISGDATARTAKRIGPTSLRAPARRNVTPAASQRMAPFVNMNLYQGPFGAMTPAQFIALK